VKHRRLRKVLISDDELDIVLARLHEKQLTEITRRLDLDAGLNAVIDPGGHLESNGSAEQEGTRLDSVPEAMVDIDSEALAAVRELLTELDVRLDRIADGDDAARACTARSTGFVSAAGRNLTALIRGLAQRTLTRAEALGALSLVEHNIKEATMLLRNEHALAITPAMRDAVQERSSSLATALGWLPELRQRVSKLFDDTPRVTEYVGSPR
jgi:hypothetical protein